MLLNGDIDNKRKPKGFKINLSRTKCNTTFKQKTAIFFSLQTMQYWAYKFHVKEEKKRIKNHRNTLCVLSRFLILEESSWALFANSVPEQYLQTLSFFIQKQLSKNCPNNFCHDNWFWSWLVTNSYDEMNVAAVAALAIRAKGQAK